METLKKKIENLSEKIKNSGIPAAAMFPKYTPESLMNADNWWEALAVCEYALDTNEDKKLTESFFELIFSAYDCNVEVDLNEEEYEFWWERVMQVCDRVGEFSGAGWSQKGAQYSEARLGKRNFNLLLSNYEKAADMGYAEAQATFAYWKYMGFYCDEDKAEGERRFEALSTPEAISWGKHYRAFIEDFRGDKEKAFRMRQELIDELPEKDRLRAYVFAAMGDAIDSEGVRERIPEIVAYYEEGIKIVPNLFVLKNLGTLYFRFPELNKPKELAFELWEKAWRAGVWSASNMLGYYYQEEEWLDIPKAIEWLEKGMLYCEWYCAYELALIYLYNDEYQNIERGLLYLERCVAADYVDGIEGLANVYFNGDFVEQDVDRTRQLLEKAIELESGNAAFNLGCLYERGFFADAPDYAKAMEYYEKAISLDNAEGCYRAAIYHDKGVLGEAKPEEAFALFAKAVELGNVEAIFDLGRYYKLGLGTEENPDKALELFRKGAENNNPSCLTELGLAYEDGMGVEMNPQQAVDYMMQAANMDYGYAQFKLGEYYFNGYGSCLEDNKTALEWYQKAIENDVPMAMQRMGDYYLYDYDELHELEKAFGYFKNAADLGWYSEGMGICYEMGIGVEKNETEALKRYMEAADFGNLASLYHIGLCYYKGVGMKKNHGEAFRYFLDAANKGSTVGIYYLGKMLMYGEGCEPDPETAMKWLMEAAERGNDKAQFEVGNAYLMGKGVEENEDLAMEWFEKAADNGNEKALKITGRRKK